jgi:hypothetical protein
LRETITVETPADVAHSLQRANITGEDGPFNDDLPF